MSADPITSAVSTVHASDVAAVLRAAGELDATGAATLGRALEEQRAHGRRFLRLDVSGVTALHASALAELVRVHRELLAEHGTLIITGVRAAVAQALRRSGLHRVLFVGGVRADDDLVAGAYAPATRLDPAAEADIYLVGGSSLAG